MPNPLPPLDTIPADLQCAADYLRRARHHLPPALHAQLTGASGQGRAQRANRHAWARLKLWPRLLTPMHNADTTLSLFGQSLPHPLLLAPVALQGLAHPEGEHATAAAAGAMGLPMVVSAMAGETLEQIATQNPGPKWFQLYLQAERAHTLDLLRRAEASGYQALVVTLDTPLQPPNLSAIRHGYRAPAQPCAVNLSAYPPPTPRPLRRGQSRILHGMLSEAPDWAELAWLRSQTRLPLLAKGVMHPHDAQRLRELGCDGLVVSNHGGRALDAAPASAEVLPALRQHLGTDYPLLVDGGIDGGEALFKALALGADAALVGRLQIAALAVAGALGVAHMLRLVSEELELTMALAGTPRLADIGPHTLYPASPPC